MDAKRSSSRAGVDPFAAPKAGRATQGARAAMKPVAPAYQTNEWTRAKRRSKPRSPVVAAQTATKAVQTKPADQRKRAKKVENYLAQQLIADFSDRPVREATNHRDA